MSVNNSNSMTIQDVVLNSYKQLQETILVSDSKVRDTRIVEMFKETRKTIFENFGNDDKAYFNKYVSIIDKVFDGIKEENSGFLYDTSLVSNIKALQFDLMTEKSNSPSTSNQLQEIPHQKDLKISENVNNHSNQSNYLWLNHSLENRLGFFLCQLDQILIHAKTFENLLDYLNRVDLNATENLVNELAKLSPRSLLFPCVDPYLEAIKELKACKDTNHFKEIVKSLESHPQVIQTKLNDIKRALNPLLEYLSSGQADSRKNIISKIETFRGVMRRWRLVEKNLIVNAQENPIEVLQKIYDLILSGSNSNLGQVHYCAEVKTQPSEWTYSELGDEDYLVFADKYLHKNPRESSAPALSKAERIETGRQYVKKLLLEGTLVGCGVTTTDDLTKPHYENKPMTPFMDCPVDNNRINPIQTVESLYKRFFSEVQGYEGYVMVDTLKEGRSEKKIQKAFIPLRKAPTIELKGHLPPCFIFNTSTNINENQFIEKGPAIDVPASFVIRHPIRNSSNIFEIKEFKYVLTYAAERYGVSSNEGHYVSWSKGKNTTLFSNSLQPNPFFNEVAGDIDRLLSKNNNIEFYCYQLEDKEKPVSMAIMKNKLLQEGDDNLCYLIVAIQAMFNNPLFSSINDTQPAIEKKRTRDCQPESEITVPAISTESKRTREMSIKDKGVDSLEFQKNQIQSSFQALSKELLEVFDLKLSSKAIKRGISKNKEIHEYHYVVLAAHWIGNKDAKHGPETAMQIKDWFKRIKADHYYLFAAYGYLSTVLLNLEKYPHTIYEIGVLNKLMHQEINALGNEILPLKSLSSSSNPNLSTAPRLDPNSREAQKYNDLAMFNKEMCNNIAETLNKIVLSLRQKTILTESEKLTLYAAKRGYCMFSPPQNAIIALMDWCKKCGIDSADYEARLLVLHEDRIGSFRRESAK